MDEEVDGEMDRWMDGWMDGGVMASSFSDASVFSVHQDILTCRFSSGV
jgi:hypothetical protein